jgi:transglutaminase-like putative cysteine protease
MNTPPLLVAAALLFWGWHTGHVVLGLLAGALLESSRLIRIRWNLNQADFNRLWNVCVVLFLGVGAFLLIDEGTISYADFFVNAGKRPEAIRQAGRSALVWFQWMPMIFFPFVLAQAFNETDRVRLATFSWWVRKQEKQQPESIQFATTVNVAMPFAAVCLLSASATAEPGPWFYYGLAALVGWALWPMRTRRHSVVTWCLLFALVAGAGFATHHGLFYLQKKLEQMNVMWFSRFARLGSDGKQSRTAIGTIGRLKLSNRIVLRVNPDGGRPPGLLREASFNQYRAPLWTVGLRRDFTAVLVEDDNETFRLRAGRASRRSATIAQYLRRGEGLLALPAGTFEIGQLPVGALKTNLFGAVMVEGGPGLAIYRARYEDERSVDSSPNPDDIRSYRQTEPAVGQVARALNLVPGLPPREAMRRVADFFSSRFQYGLYRSDAHLPRANQTALERFLLHTRSGHCEYFATATALLLREAGLPTRYAVGYAVQEQRGDNYIVRERHGHAWAQVFYENAWHDFDTTPGEWHALESRNRSWLQPVKDFFSDLWFQFSKFRWGKTEWRKYFMWAPVPVFIVVLARFFAGKQWKRLRKQLGARVRERSLPGVDSEFYRIEKYFARRGLERLPGETWHDWLGRIEEHENIAGQLDRVLALHHRHRFDPRGLGEGERAELRSEVAAWLSKKNNSG